MTILETVAKFKLLNCTVDIQSTGSVDYKRGFITGSDGVSYGRITFYKGTFHHLKWYWREYSESTLNYSDYLIWGFKVLYETGEILTKRSWEDACKKAAKLQRQDVHKKLEWRRQNPPGLNKEGRVKHRKRISGRNVRYYLYDILLG